MKNKQTTIEAILGSIVTGALGLWASLLLLATVLFGLKLPMSEMTIWLSAIVSLFFQAWYVNKVAQKKAIVFLSSCLMLVLLFGFSIFLAGNVYDLSYDGQAYHQEAIIQLARGWNPIYTRLDGQATANLERWLNHYPKGTWIMSASVYLNTGNIESGKFLSILLPLVAFLAGIWAMWQFKLKKIYVVFVSFLLAFNPVVIYQGLSYYVDGVLVSMLLILAFLGMRLSFTKERTVLWSILFAMVVIPNIKLVAIAFNFILIFTIIMHLWMRDLVKLSLVAMKFSLLGLILGTLVVGYNPFVTNFVLKGHWLYPALGKGAIDYLPTNLPENYWEVVTPARLLLSIFSESSLVRGNGQEARLKLPFTVSAEELKTFRETNAKVGGFGPLFSGVFLLSGLLTVWYLFSARSNKRKLYLIGALTVVFASAMLVSMNSVARYVPFVWWSTGLVILCMLLEKKTVMSLSALGLGLMMLFNIALVAYASVPYNLAESRKLGERLQELADKGEPVVIDVDQFGSTKIKLQEFGIKYEEVNETVECKSRQRLLPHNVTEVCELN